MLPAAPSLHGKDIANQPSPACKSNSSPLCPCGTLLTCTSAYLAQCMRWCHLPLWREHQAALLRREPGYSE